MKSQTAPPSRLNLLTVLLAFLLSSACTPTPPPTPFIPPKAATPTQPLVLGATPIIPTSTPLPEPVASPTATPPCVDGLAFVEDVSIPDGTTVSPGSSVDKRWLVQNNGSCNWDARYRLKFVGGLEMGAATSRRSTPPVPEPRRPSASASSRQTEPGTYTTAWQAIDPNGEPFGDAIFMEIQVSP